MTLNQSSDDRYSRTRIFLLPLEGRAREHVIACSVRRVGGDGAPLDVEQEVADAEGLLNSLSFAAEVASAQDRSRLGHCPACEWVFLVETRNGKRRWCDMADCGSRAKSRRYYARTHT
jgi:predicted RNA-binding Zn ribbon-like protein